MFLCGFFLFYEKGIIIIEKKDFILRKYSVYVVFDFLIEKYFVLKFWYLYR